VHPLNLSFERDENHLDAVIRLVIGKYDNIKFPVVFKQEYGKKLQDILDTGTASLYLISDKMKQVFEANNLTGWKTFAVKVFSKQGQEIEGYHGLSILGRCGARNESKSEVIMKQFVPNGPFVKYFKGLHIGLDKWDGSDFFLEDKTTIAIVTRKVADILKKHKFTNIRLVNLADYEVQDFGLQNEI